MKKKGFTLVEIMIVVAIIALLAAISIPNLLRARVTAQETAAAAALHTIAAAEIQWRASNNAYASLDQLGPTAPTLTLPPYIDATLETGVKQGYTFTVTPNAGVNFFAVADSNNATAGHAFYIDEAGVLCRSTAEGTGSALAAHQSGICPAAHPEM
ncbi:MAG: prepilin-type N-terminal cleavage/methylation domain-containing protein [Candidatus Omnitrophota bacterium]